MNTRVPLRLGCIADDFTGATDLANNLVRAGMRVVQTIGVPSAPLGTAADAVVVGSRLVQEIEAATPETAKEQLTRLVATLKAAIR